MIKFKCTQCDHEYRVGDDYAGKKVRCKSCQAVNVIPEPTPACGDSLARFNVLLQELLECEKRAPSLDAEAT